jgi:hypothetical protein
VPLPGSRPVRLRNPVDAGLNLRAEGQRQNNHGQIRAFLLVNKSAVPVRNALAGHARGQSFNVTGQAFETITQEADSKRRRQVRSHRA